MQQHPHEKLLELILEAILQKVAEDMSPELLDKLFSLDPSDPQAHQLLKGHIDSRHKELRSRKSAKYQPAPAPARSNRRRSDGTPDVFDANHASQMARSILGGGR